MTRVKYNVPMSKGQAFLWRNFFLLPKSKFMNCQKGGFTNHNILRNSKSNAKSSHYDNVLARALRLLTMGQGRINNMVFFPSQTPT